MTQPLVKSETLRLAMLGMVDGNGHPYSWSAIFNGYDAAEMAHCPYSSIPDYLGKEAKETLRIPHAQVTHVWCDDPSAAAQVARASLVPHVVERPEDVIGQVDAVLIATDIGHQHVARCRPFVEAGVPIFVDKPMVDNAQDLRTFIGWINGGAAILSSSSMRYAKEFMPYRISTSELGALRYASITTPKSWERYGIHAIEAIYPIFGPGFLSARNSGEAGRDIVHFKHASGADAVVVAIDDMYGAFGALQLCGTAGQVQLSARDTFYSFKAQLLAFVEYLRTGKQPYPFAETVELMKMVIAGILSRQAGGREVALSSIEVGQ